MKNLLNVTVGIQCQNQKSTVAMQANYTVVNAGGICRMTQMQRKMRLHAARIYGRALSRTEWYAVQAAAHFKNSNLKQMTAEEMRTAILRGDEYYEIGL